MSLIKWMPTHQIEIYGTEYYTKKLPYNVCGSYYPTPTPPVSWLGCLFFVEFIELKKCVPQFCVPFMAINE